MKSMSWKSALHICVWYVCNFLKSLWIFMSLMYFSLFPFIWLRLCSYKWFLMLLLGLWSAATRPCRCRIKSLIVPAGRNWRKYTSYICVTGYFFLLCYWSSMLNFAWCYIFLMNLCLVLCFIVFHRMNYKFFFSFLVRMHNKKDQHLFHLWCLFLQNTLCSQMFLMPSLLLAMSRSVLIFSFMK